MYIYTVYIYIYYIGPIIRVSSFSDTEKQCPQQGIGLEMSNSFATATDLVQLDFQDV